MLAAALASARIAAQDREVTFIHLNDLHANLTAHTDLVRAGHTGSGAHAVTDVRGGLARIATLVSRIRAEKPGASVLMNIGDTYHGTAEALYTRGNALIAPVDALQVDIGVPGNWDFAYNPIVTRLRYATGSTWLAALVNKAVFGEAVEKPGYPLLGGNVRKSLGLLLEDEPLLPTTYRMTVNGIRIGFIGITSDIVPRMSPMLALGFTFLQGQQAYENLVNSAMRELRAEGVDLVVVMSELGLHRDFQLANHIEPGVDVFFSAHTHEVTEEPLLSASGALVVESGNDGYLGRMTATLPESGPPAFRWEILPVTADIPEDPAMARLVDAARAPFLQRPVHFDFPLPNTNAPLDQPLDHVVARSPALLHRRGVLGNPFNEYLADQIRAYYRTDVALTPGFRFDAVVPKGAPLTLDDLYRYLPVPATLASGMITGRNLKALLEKELNSVFSRDAFEHSGGWFPGISGLQLQVDLERGNGERIVSMRTLSSDAELGMDEQLSVASCVRPFDKPGVLCSGEGFTDITPLLDPAGKEWTPLQFLARQLQAGSPQRRGGQVRDVSNSPAWPEAPLMQPMHP